MTGASPVERFVAGAIGPPGERTFYLEVDTDDSHDWYLVEKAQVAALAEEGSRLLADLGFTGTGAGIELGDISEPSRVAFRVGELALVYAEGSEFVTITARGATDDEVATWAVTPAQLDAVVTAARRAVAAGRPKCPRCGLAMDRDGHVCPTTNGDLRGHRP